MATGSSVVISATMSADDGRLLAGNILNSLAYQLFSVGRFDPDVCRHATADVSGGLPIRVLSLDLGADQRFEAILGIARTVSGGQPCGALPVPVGIDRGQ